MALCISSLDTEYLRVRVSAEEAGVAVNPTGDTVEMAFPATGIAPVSGDWKSASWETDGAAHYARCLVGPTAVVLAAGLYDVWVRVTDSPEIVVRKTGQLKIV